MVSCMQPQVYSTFVTTLTHMAETQPLPHPPCIPTTHATLLLFNSSIFHLVTSTSHYLSNHENIMTQSSCFSLHRPSLAHNLQSNVTRFPPLPPSNVCQLIHLCLPSWSFQIQSGPHSTVAPRNTPLKATLRQQSRQERRVLEGRREGENGGKQGRERGPGALRCRSRLI